MQETRRCHCFCCRDALAQSCTLLAQLEAPATRVFVSEWLQWLQWLQWLEVWARVESEVAGGPTLTVAGGWEALIMVLKTLA